MLAVAMEAQLSVYVRDSGRSPYVLTVGAKLTYVAVLPALILRSCQAARLEYWAAGPFGRVEARMASDWPRDQYTRLLADWTATIHFHHTWPCMATSVWPISVPRCLSVERIASAFIKFLGVETLRALDG